MSVLTTEQRLRILAALVDGNSERATQRMVDVERKTIGRLAMRFGAGAQYLHNRLARDLALSLIEVDEIWSYVKIKAARATEAHIAAGCGEAYTFTALGMPSRFIATWKVGKRDQETADAFTDDLRARLVVMPAMTSDGFAPYVSAIGKSFGPGVDYAQTIKNYRTGSSRGPDHRYEPARDPFITKKSIFGAPDISSATTAHMERNNGTMRHHIGRMRRLCYAFSKNPDHHKAAIALCYCHYNLCWIPRTMRETPAMAAGVTDHVWELPEFMDAILSAESCEAPVKQSLTPRKPATTARELPNGRGFLRVVSSGGAGPAPSGPAPSPAPPAAPTVAVAVASSPAPALTPSAAPGADPRQLDLLAWRARPAASTPPVARQPSRRLPPGQLGLFGIDFEPEPEK